MTLKLGPISRAFAGIVGALMFFGAYRAREFQDWRAVAGMSSLGALCILAALTGKDPYNERGTHRSFRRTSESDAAATPPSAKLSSLDRAFERHAKEFLAVHPEVQCEWRPVKQWHGERLDIVCGVGLPNEVFASLLGRQIAVGSTGGEHDDFEDFGRGLTDQQVAEEAFDRFVTLLSEQGHLKPAA